MFGDREGDRKNQAVVGRLSPQSAPGRRWNRSAETVRGANFQSK